MIDLDRPDREELLRERILNKKSLWRLYQEYYSLYLGCIQECPTNGINLEIGSGVGLIEEVLPDVVTSDVLLYNNVDIIVDAMCMPFESKSLNSVFMLNTLHHIPDVALFFQEIDRCLKPRGRLLIIDQFSSTLSDFIFKYLHHEPYDKNAKQWQFDSSGPLSGANGALCWIIFYRDIEYFKKTYPNLQILQANPHTPLRYWIAGGLKKWSALPDILFNFWTKIDRWLSEKNPDLCSFVVIEIEKTTTRQ